MYSLIISDLHGHNWPTHSHVLPDGTNSRFADLLGIFDQVEQYVEKYGPDSLLILGDVTHRRYFVQFSIYTKIAERLLRLRKMVSRLTVMVGNHDIEAHGVHSLGPLRLMGLDVIDTPAWRPEGLFVPYMHEGVVLAVTEPPALGQNRDNMERVFLHYALDGKVLTNEFALPSALRLEHLEGFEQIIMGHIHQPGIEQDGRVVYVGAPMHFDFGDSGARFCWLLDRDTNLMTPLPLSAPKFLTATYPRIPVKGFSEEGFLRVLGVPAKEFADVKEQGLATGWAEVVPVEAQIPTEAVQAITSGRLLDEQTIREYVEQHLPDLTTEEQAPVVDYGLSCLQEAEDQS